MAHLALFVSSLPRGAIQRMMLNLAEAFVARGHRVDLLAGRLAGPRPAGLPEAVRVIGLDTAAMRLPLVRGSKRWWVPRAADGLADYLRRERPDALLSGGEYPNLTALRARERAGVATRVVTSDHVHVSRGAAGGPLRRKWRLRRAVRRWYPRADGVIGVSEGVADDIAAFAGLPRGRVTAIHNPVVTPELIERSRAPLDHPWFRAGEPPVFVCAAALRAQKDLPTLLRAFARLRAERPARLLVVGEGNRRPELEGLAANLDIAADVALPGYVANPLPYMREAAAFVLSSAYEGLANVLVEAMLCGCPVISTDCPSGPREVLDGGRYGTLVPVGDEAALARAMLAALGAPRRSDELRARAQAFHVDRAADRYLGVLLGETVEDSGPAADVAAAVPAGQR